MITGDHPTTARSIATEIGLLGEEGLVIEGDDLPEDDQILGALLDRDGVVVSRVSPEDKLRIARTLQDRGHVVAMTGMASTTARRSRKPTSASRWGVRGRTSPARRRISSCSTTTSKRRQRDQAGAGDVLQHQAVPHLSPYRQRGSIDTVRRLGAGSGTVPLALGILQILALDIGTDLLPALALGSEPPSEDVLQQPLKAEHLIDETVSVAPSAFSVRPRPRSRWLRSSSHSPPSAGYRAVRSPEQADLLAASGRRSPPSSSAKWRTPSPVGARPGGPAIWDGRLTASWSSQSSSNYSRCSRSSSSVRSRGC